MIGLRSLQVSKADLRKVALPIPYVIVCSNFTDVGNSETVVSAVGVSDIDKLPFGACDDPIVEMYLFTTWPNMSEDVVTESSVYS